MSVMVYLCIYLFIHSFIIVVMGSDCVSVEQGTLMGSLPIPQTIMSEYGAVVELY
jgi:hypothetical protein